MTRLLPAFVALLSLMAGAEAGCGTPGQDVRGKVRSYRTSEVAKVDLASTNGWSSLPDGGDVCGARLERDYTLNDQGLTLPLYISSDVVDVEVERVVLGMPAKLRDGWAYFTAITNARNKAYGDNADVDKSKIVVIVPQFLNIADKKAGSAGPTDIIFKGLSWSWGEQGYKRSGGDQELGGEELSSFDIFDQIFKWAAQKYPKATRHVMVGHSLGAQTVNRYATLRKKQEEVRRIDYLIGNPGSWLWMTSDRPKSDPSCKDVDTFKYGVSEGLPSYSGDATRDTLMQNVASRNVHILLGANDHGPGDTSCEAGVQGASHLERGNNYIKSVKSAFGGKLPSTWTVDYPPCSHDPNCVFNSDAGLKRIFLDESNSKQGMTKKLLR